MKEGSHVVKFPWVKISLEEFSIKEIISEENSFGGKFYKGKISWFYHHVV